MAEMLEEEELPEASASCQEMAEMGMKLGLPLAVMQGNGRNWVDKGML